MNKENKELNETYEGTKDIDKRSELGKEIFERASEKVMELSKPYSVKPFIEHFTWACKYESQRDFFYLVNDDIGIDSIEAIGIAINKKLLLDSIVLKTTTKDGHNTLLENMTERNLALLNSFILKLTSKECLTLSMKELKEYILVPCLLREEDIKVLKGEYNENRNSNDIIREQKGTEATEDNGKSNSMVGREHRRNSATDSECEGFVPKGIDKHLWCPTGADTVADDSQFDGECDTE